MPAGKRTPAGDLLVTVVVAVPDKLTDEQRAAVEQLALVLDGAPRALPRGGERTDESLFKPRRQIRWDAPCT